MNSNFSIFEPDDDCHCGGKCCDGGDTLGLIRNPPQVSGGSDGGVLNCVHGDPYTDPNGVIRCPNGPAPSCGSGYHVEGNVFGDLICAPNTCPDGTHMGWNTSGSQVICAPNAPTTPTPQTCPPGYRWNAASNSCIRNPIAALPAPAPGGGGDAAQPATGGLFGLSPLMLIAIAGGGILLLSSMGDDKKGR